jgi:hypothetical protein
LIFKVVLLKFLLLIVIAARTSTAKIIDIINILHPLTDIPADRLGCLSIPLTLIAALVIPLIAEMTLQIFFDWPVAHIVTHGLRVLA